MAKTPKRGKRKARPKKPVANGHASANGVNGVARKGALQEALAVPVRYEIPQNVVVAVTDSKPGELNPKQRAFLIAFAISGNVTKAAADAGVSRMVHAIRWMKKPPYRRVFNMAKQEASDRLLLEARRRAEYGVQKVLVHKGQVVVDPETGKPLIERQYSDSLMLSLLKATRPEFRDQNNLKFSGKIEHKGKVEHEHSAKCRTTDLTLEEQEALLAIVREVKRRKEEARLLPAPAPVEEGE